MRFDPMTVLRRFAMFTVAVACLFLVCSVFAQTNATAGPIDDSKAISFFAKFASWQLFLVPVLVVLVEVIKRTITAIPASAIPWLVPILGAVLNYLANKFGLWTGSAEAGAVLGGLAVWFNEAFASKAINKIAPEKPDQPG